MLQYWHARFVTMPHSQYGTEQISTVDAQAMLPELPMLLAEEKRAVAITHYGRPVLAGMSWKLFESIAETLETMADADTMAAL